MIELEVHVDISGGQLDQSVWNTENLEINDAHQQIDDNYFMRLGAK